MKRVLHILLALALTVCLLAGCVSAALDRSVLSHSTVLSDRTELYSGTWLLENGKSVHENYVRFDGERAVQPIVAYGSELYGTSTIIQIAKQLAEDGLSIVAGINAAFFDMDTGIPYGLVVTDGVLRSASTDFPSVGFYADGAAVIGSPELELTLETPDGGSTAIFYNKRLTTKNGIGLYSRDYDSKTKNTVPAYNLLLEPVGSEAELHLHGTLELTVAGYQENTASCSIPEGSFVLSIAEDSVYATAVENMKALQKGDRVTIRTDCAPDWRDVTYACSGNELLVEDGDAYSDFSLDSAKNSAARTAIGLTRSGTLVLYTADGGENSQGLTLAELAERMVEEGCVIALNLDGGGSSSLGATYPGYASGATVNDPEDGALRACANFIFLVRQSTDAEDAASLHLYHNADAVLPGAQLSLNLKAADANYMAASLPGEVSYSADGGSINAKGVLTVDSDASGYVSVRAFSGDLETGIKIPVLDTITSLSVVRQSGGAAISSLTVFGGSETKLTAQAAYHGGRVAVDNASFRWSVPEELGTVSENGVFTAAEATKKLTGTLTVSYGEVKQEIKLTIVPENPFVDMKTHWAKEYVNELYLDGVLTGSTGSDGKLRYRPDDSMTRQEFIVALMRFLGVDAAQYSGTKLPYDDASKIASWAEDAMKAAYKLGYMSGSSSGGKLYAKPESTISRQEAMVILARTQKLTSESTTALSKFSDAAKVADWARSELTAMVQKGIISGSGGKLNPTGNVTRAEVAKMLYALRNASDS